MQGPISRFRTAVAATAANLATAASRATGRGAGGMIGGLVAAAIDPNIMASLGGGRPTVLVTGTNGKSTTTRMLAGAVRAKRTVATNDGGDNMDAGIISALLAGKDAEAVVLEVDELHVPKVAERLNPAAFVLLNLTRDQLDRVGAINSLSLTLDRSSSQADVIRRVDALLEPYGGGGAYGREDQPSHAFVENELSQLRAMGRVIPPVFLLTSTFLVYVVLARLIQTELPSVAPKVLDKTVRITGDRVRATGGELVGETRCPHEPEALAAMVRQAQADGFDMLLIAGASAITDRNDVLPAGIVAAGGAVEHFGMPVDPGNLLLIGSAGGVPVLGAPGCARSPQGSAVPPLRATPGPTP